MYVGCRSKQSYMLWYQYIIVAIRYIWQRDLLKLKAVGHSYNFQLPEKDVGSFRVIEHSFCRNTLDIHCLAHF